MTDRALEHMNWDVALLIEWGIPAHLHTGLELYLKEHLRPGHFLSAVLSNDLAKAHLFAATPEAEAAIGPLVRFLTDEAPGTAWGSVENFEAWIHRRKEWLQERAR